MSTSLDPDQARLIVGPDLDPNCLQRLLADVTSRQRVNLFFIYFPVDETRVTLQEKPGEEGSDYINANFILVSAINFDLNTPDRGQ